MSESPRAVRPPAEVQEGRRPGFTGLGTFQILAWMVKDGVGGGLQARSVLRKAWSCGAALPTLNCPPVGTVIKPLLWGPSKPHLQSAQERVLVAQRVKTPPAPQETQVQSLGQEDAMEKGMASHSSIPAWEFLWTEEPGGPQSMGSRRVRTERLTLHFFQEKQNNQARGA